MNNLEQGIIPIGKACPWEKQCPIYELKCCRRGAGYQTNYSCGAARCFDINNTPTDEMEGLLEGE